MNSTASGSVAAGEEYHLAVTFGDDGFTIYLDGQMSASNAEFTQGIENNAENLVVGANTWARSASKPYGTWNNFDGQISDFTIYDSQYDHNAIAAMAEIDEELVPQMAMPSYYHILRGDSAENSFRTALKQFYTASN